MQLLAVDTILCILIGENNIHFHPPFTSILNRFFAQIFRLLNQSYLRFVAPLTPLSRVFPSANKSSQKLLTATIDI
jgi:hypothetical protein